jgi:hypothetical protein
MFIVAVHSQHNSIPLKILSPAGTPRWIQSNTGRERLGQRASSLKPLYLFSRSVT